MKILLSSRILFALGFVMLVATNVIVLSGVAFNRSGEPESQITLTERELQLPYQVHKENSGLALRLTWRALGKVEDDSNYSEWRSPVWFNAEKLEELGFNVNEYLSSDGNATFYKQPIPKEVLVVLEYGGEPYRDAVRRAESAFEKEENSLKLNSDDKRLRDNFERAEKQLKREKTEETKLFAIDAGLDVSALRAKYGDRTRFIITEGLVKPRIHYNKNKKEVFGYISRLSVASIYVPFKHRHIFDPILSRKRVKKNDSGSPRYTIKLAYGNRLEPWILEVKLVSD